MPTHFHRSNVYSALPASRERARSHFCPERAALPSDHAQCTAVPHILRWWNETGSHTKAGLTQTTAYQPHLPKLGHLHSAFRGDEGNQISHPSSSAFLQSALVLELTRKACMPIRPITGTWHQVTQLHWHQTEIMTGFSCLYSGNQIPPLPLAKAEYFLVGYQLKPNQTKIRQAP